MRAGAAKRILHIKPGGWGTGGVEAFLMSMFENVDRSRVVFDVLTIVHSEEPGTVDERLEELGGRRYICVEARRGPTLSKLRPLLVTFGLVRRNGYDTVHIHTGSPFHGLYAWVARWAGASTVILHSHVTQRRNLPRPVGTIVEATLGPAPTHRFACSTAAGQALFPKWSQAAVKVVRNGIDIDSFRLEPATRSRLRAELGIADGQLAVGHVGRFSWEKNHELLVRAFGELAAASPEPRPVLVCVGDGEDRPAIEELADQLGIASSVRFVGLRHDIADLLAAVDVFVLPSHNEGLGIAGIEAQAAGLPCVFSTGVPAEVDVIGNNTFLPTTASPQEWAAAIREAATRPRADNLEKVRSAGYDASLSAKDLQDFYLRAEPRATASDSGWARRARRRPTTSQA